MNTNIPVTNYELSRGCICWTAIFAGALVALGLGFLLQLFGLAIGLSAYHAADSGGASTLAIGGYLGLLVGAIASMGIAGFIAGHHGRFNCYLPHESFIYGFLTWCLALVFSAVLIMPLTQYVAVYTNVISPRVAVSNQLPQHVMVSKNPTNAGTMQEKTDTQPEVAVTPAAITGGFWLLFVLFFIGAFSSCLGAYCGMRCKQKHCALQMNNSL